MVNSNYQAFTLRPAQPGYVPVPPQLFLSHSSAEADFVEWIAGSGAASRAPSLPGRTRHSAR